MTRRAEFLWLAAITLIAAAVRFPGLGAVPPGVTLDEGRLGLFAQAVLRAEDIRPWIHSMEPPSWIPTVALFSVLPDSLAVLRLVPAAWGTLTVAAMWWALRPVAGPAIALAAAGVLAVLRWHVALTRVAVCPYLMVLGAIVAAGCLVRAIASPHGRWWWWSGMTAGYTMHLYAGARVLPLVIGAGVAGWWSAAGDLPATLRRRAVLHWLGGMAAGFVLGGWYLLEHPEWFLVRTTEVTGEIRDAGSLARNILRGLLALNVGGSDLMHTFPAPGGSALLGAVAGLAWIPGLVIVLRGAARPVRWMLGAWLVAGFSGGAFSGPHGMRQFLLAPVAATAAGAAAVLLVRRMPGRWAVAAAVMLGLAHAGAELWRYALGPHGGLDPRVVEWAYRGQEVAMAARLRAEAVRRPVFWSPAALAPAGTPLEWYAAATILLSTPPVRRDLPDTVSALAASGGMVAFPMVSLPHLDLLRELYPGGEVWAGESIDPRKLVVYAVGSGSLRRGKLPLARTSEVFGELWRAELDIERGRPDAAVTRCDGLATHWPRIGGILTIKCAALLRAGRMAEGEVAGREAVRRGAAGGLVRLYLGGAQLRLGRFAQAADTFKVAIRETPDSEEAWLGRVAALANSGRRDEARILLQEAVGRFPASAAAAGLAAQIGMP